MHLNAKKGSTMSFADNLVYLRQHYGVTQEGLAEQLGVSRQTISKWEAGTNYPEMDKLLVLCDLFHTNLDDLMRGSVHVVKESDTERYDRHMNLFDLSIAAGVMLILIGVGVIGILEAIGLPDNLQAVALLSFVVVGVVILVMGSLNHGEFKRRNPAIEPRYPAETLDRFGRRFPVMIAGGVGLILLAVIMLIGLTPDDGSMTIGGIVMDDLVIAPFMFILAIAVGILIWASMQKSKYDLSELTYIAHRKDLGADLPATAIVKTPEQVRADRIMGVICGCIMLLATIVFLVWGLVPLFDQIGGWDGMDKFALKDAIRSGQGGFAVSWIAFAVGGILCGIVYLLGSVVFKSQDDWIAEARKEDAWMKVAQADAKEDPWTRGPAGSQESAAGPTAPGAPVPPSTSNHDTGTWK